MATTLGVAVCLRLLNLVCGIAVQILHASGYGNASFKDTGVTIDDKLDLKRNRQ
jgi:hypothetical protein